eukprot:1112507-Pleurochrysis_carterae.AAC.1
MGAKISLVGKDDTRKDKWFKEALRASMTLGNEKYPGSVAAWFLGRVCLIGQCKLGKRSKVASSTGRPPSFVTFVAHALYRCSSHAKMCSLT